jgi:hypothetical protein
MLLSNSARVAICQKVVYINFHESLLMVLELLHACRRISRWHFLHFEILPFENATRKEEKMFPAEFYN